MQGRGFSPGVFMKPAMLVPQLQTPALWDWERPPPSGTGRACVLLLATTFEGTCGSSHGHQVPFPGSLL